MASAYAEMLVLVPDFTVAQLRSELKKFGVIASGNKAVLQARLEACLKVMMEKEEKKEKGDGGDRWPSERRDSSPPWLDSRRLH